MCRICGFRSVILSQVHQSLIHADNALQYQGEYHPDGWGVAYYVAGAPHVVKSKESALDDHLFKRVSGVVSSQTVVAHIRKATLGNNNILNTHPFQFGKWIFAHNGNIKNFSNYREQLLKLIKPELRRFILGDTDSEIVFYLLLSKISEKSDITRDFSYQILRTSVEEGLEAIQKIVGEFETDEDAGNTETYFTFILTDGKMMIAHHGGQELHYSTYKTKCFDRDRCPSFSKECEAPTQSGFVNHLIFSSEVLQGENIWTKMKPSEIIGINSQMKLFTP